jgi:polyhydroxyalkanoate synthase subunit PhaC
MKVVTRIFKAGGNTMSKQKINLGDEAAQNTVALTAMMGLAREDLMGAVALMMREVTAKPATTAKHMKALGDDVVKILKNESDLAPAAKDKRFQDITFKYNPIYRMGMQYYLAVQKNVGTWLADLELDELEKARATFVSQMIIDSVAPTNSLFGNPAAMKRAYESGGMSLIKGLQNAYRDLTENGGQVSQVDTRPFKVGENIATSKGNVIYKTEMMELIQYEPTGEKVHAIPFLIIPPQINKAYVNDLSPDKSIVKFLGSLGLTTFLVSWRNPKVEHRAWGLEMYVNELIKASDVILAVTKSKTLNVSGACSGGITTATFLSKLASDGDTRVNAVSLMVNVLDPRNDDSDVGALVSEHGIEMARQRSMKKGILEGDSMGRMFAWLRPNDLIWNYVINNYLMGQDPPPFDVLFWNNDTTNLPAQLHSDYLDMYPKQPFANPGQVEFAGHVVDMTKVKQDVFIIAGVTDHITPWKACYRTTQLLGSENIEFVLSHSGHIQALLNPPGNPKSKFYRNTNGKPPATTDEWMAGATEVAGSWWPLWGEWLKARSGAEKAATKVVGNKDYPAGDPAPGRYAFND